MINPSQPVHHETTYQMLVESEEKEHGIVEDIVYLLLVIATSAAIWQLSHQPVTFAEMGVEHAPDVAALVQS
jgi:hypothetical protein